jgi:hypothetical protein
MFFYPASAFEVIYSEDGGGEVDSRESDYSTQEPVSHDVVATDETVQQSDDYIQLSYNSKKRHGKKYKNYKNRDSGLASSRPATGRRVFIFNPNSQRWAVYERDGSLVRTGHGSAGRHYCPDVRRGCKTPSGTYSLRAKMGPGFRSSRYPLPRGGAPMPYAMFFSKYYAIHGSNDVPHYNASHGCVRVYTSDARWLSGYLPYGSTIIIRPY